MTSSLRIGIAGIGTVGVGVIKILNAHANLLEKRAGRPVILTAVSARSQNKDRGVDLSPYTWEDDPVQLASRDDVDLFIELIGGENSPALDAVKAALSNGKHVVTANKAMLAHHGQELAELAEAQKVSLRYEAAVAGGIPIVKSMLEAFAGNQVTRILGVMNGSCNYILTRMEDEEASYERIFQDSQRLGYLETDPSLDVGGIDAAHKLAILSSIAFGTQIAFQDVDISGIEQITLLDINEAKQLGYKIKLVGIAEQKTDGIIQKMSACLVPSTSPLGQLHGVSNMVIVEGDAVGQCVLQGAGAGEGATASAVMGDAMDIARGTHIPTFGVPATDLSPAIQSSSSISAPYYLRLSLKDEAGTLAQISNILSEHYISIDQIQQHAHEDQNDVPVVIITHDASQKDIDKAINTVAQLDICTKPTISLRIEQV